MTNVCEILNELDAERLEMECGIDDAAIAKASESGWYSDPLRKWDCYSPTEIESVPLQILMQLID